MQIIVMRTKISRKIDGKWVKIIDSKKLLIAKSP